MNKFKEQLYLIIKWLKNATKENGALHHIILKNKKEGNVVI